MNSGLLMKMTGWEDLKQITFSKVKSTNVLNIYSNPLAVFEEPKQFNTSAAICLSY